MTKTALEVKVLPEDRTLYFVVEGDYSHCDNTHDKVLNSKGDGFNWTISLEWKTICDEITLNENKVSKEAFDKEIENGAILIRASTSL